MTRFTPTLGHDPAYMKAEDNSIPYVMTKNDRDTAHIVRLDIIAQTRRAKLTDFVPGLPVIELKPEDLTESEREAFGL